MIAFSYTITNIGGDFGCKLGKLLRLSPQLREKREKRKVAVSALCNQHIGKSRMSAHR